MIHVVDFLNCCLAAVGRVGKSMYAVKSLLAARIFPIELEIQSM